MEREKIVFIGQLFKMIGVVVLLMIFIFAYFFIIPGSVAFLIWKMTSGMGDHGLVITVLFIFLVVVILKKIWIGSFLPEKVFDLLFGRRYLKSRHGHN